MSNDIKWSIDQTHSEINFKVRHLLISNVRGLFKTFDASIYTSGKDFKTAVIDLWIDTDSITTGDAKRDEHLRSADFFDTENFKQINFVANTMEAAGPDGNHDLWGELTMKGITKNVKLSVAYGGIMKDPWGNEKAGFTVTGVINRTEWGLVWNTTLETGGFMVSDDIYIEADIQLINIGFKDLTMTLASVDDLESIQ